MFAAFRWSLVLSLLLMSSTLAQGQRPRSSAPRNIADIASTDVKGTFESIEYGKLKLKTNEGTPCYVVVQAPMTQVAITGTAMPDYLKPGQLVTFYADVDKKGAAAEPLKELTITVASDTTKQGMFLENRDDKDSTKFFVCATVRTFKDGKLTVSAGGKPVQATVADDAKIKYEGTDVGVIKAGDKVSLSGKQVQAYNGAGNVVPQVMYGEKVEIALGEPLSAASSKKKPPVKGK